MLLFCYQIQVTIPSVAGLDVKHNNGLDQMTLVLLSIALTNADTGFHPGGFTASVVPVAKEYWPIAGGVELSKVIEVSREHP